MLVPHSNPIPQETSQALDNVPVVRGTSSQDPGAVKQLNLITPIWMAVVGFFFLTFSLDGYFLRLYQSELFPKMRPEWFYAVLTLHGVGMVGLWFVAGMAVMTYLLARYLRPPLWAAWMGLAGTLVGFALLFVSTTRGLFGTGWYFLYPLPFYSQGTWPPWATGCFFASIVLMSAVWLIWSLAMITAILRRYRLHHALGWHYLAQKARKAGPEVPPLVLIAFAALIIGILGFTDAFAVFAYYFMQWRVKGFVANALLMKNLTFFFGHMMVHASMYLGVATVYEMLPRFSNRSWKTNRIIALAWNMVLAMVFFAYFHHLYMDFVEPRMLQLMGQMMSYVSAVPAAVVSIFDGLLVVYGSRMRWTIASTFMFLGLMGWAVGGVGAVIDSTISLNYFFHNTLWVPAHFHTYYLMGVVLMVMGFASHLAVELSGMPDSRAVRRAMVALFLIGGYGFVLMFFWAGAHSIPRRFAIYPQELYWGTHDARVSSIFIGIFVVGLLLFLWVTGWRYLKIFWTQFREGLLESYIL